MKTGLSERFSKVFENRVEKTIKKYGLFTKRDKVLVACSGGKDSTVCLYVLHKLGYDVEAITIDVLIGNYTKQNLANLRQFCQDLNIRLHEVSFREAFGKSLCYIQSTLRSKGVRLNSCTTCGVLRRYLVNKHSRGISPSCVATGHNLDDEAQAVFMNLLRNNLKTGARLGPKTGLVKDNKFVPRVKPLYFCTEEECKRYSKIHKFNVKYEPCPCRTDSFRNKVRMMLDTLEKDNPKIKQNILISFLDLLPKLKKSYEAVDKVGSCRYCGEPAKGQVCAACTIIDKLN